MNSRTNYIPVSIIIPTYRRTRELISTLHEIAKCSPAADEIIVHVDGGDLETADIIGQEFPLVRIIQSKCTLGPGGSRNLLLGAARNETVVSLDDDSFPIDSDFIAAAHASLSGNQEAAVIAMSIIHDNEPMIARSTLSQEVPDFVGCGCVYRKSAFLDTQGYVPIQPAYGVEEADLTLQLHDAGWKITQDSNLRVRHATTLEHHISAEITAAHISNIALLTYLRYPLRYWPYGLLQMMNRILWSIKQRRYAGIIASAPLALQKVLRFRKLRRPITPQSMRRVRRLRHAQR